MGKLVVGPIDKGMVNNRTAFNVDNDAFPTLMNAYQWRGRVKRKRGTSKLGRLTRYFSSASTAYGTDTSMVLVLASGNLLSGFSLEAGSIVPGTVTFTDATSGKVYTDPAMDGTLSGTGAGSGTINYANGNIFITAGAGNTINTASFQYYPQLPVMGLEEFTTDANAYPGCIAFDTKYSYNISTNSPYLISSVSFFNNPATSGAYTQKTTWTPATWNGLDYQQFWTTNYQGAMWATSGVQVPFNTSNIGMPFQTNGTIAWVNATTITIDFATATPIVGDFVFVNEITTNSTVNAVLKKQSINFQAGYVTVVAGATRTIVFPNAVILDPAAGDAGKIYSGGITQLLTNRSDITKDCIRWYNGDPTNDASPPTFATGKGWVNFCPPISQSNFSIADLPAAQYYLVGCRMITQFKDRLLFLGPVVQTSTGSPIYLQDTVVYSQNGTPYYTSSFDSSTIAKTPTSAGVVFNPILVPSGQTATAPAYFADSTGFGGFITAGLDQPIVSVSSNEDVLMLGFNPSYQVRFVYTGNDIVPFNFFIINSEYGTASTFSAINLDRGVMSRGPRGFVLSNQVEVSRFDLAIPDEVFEIALTDNGSERVCAQRDFISEWVYFTYPANYTSFKFPNQTLQYNYRDDSWGLFRECYTTYGTFKRQTGNTWATIGLTYPTWDDWNVPWNAGSSTLLQPEVIAGNQQGFVITRDEGTGEAPSLAVSNVSFNCTITAATKANPCVLTSVNAFVVGQTITITGVAGMTQLNGNTYTITAVTSTTITINADSTAYGVYTSGGLIIPVEPIYSINHGLNTGDYITFKGVLGNFGGWMNDIVFRVGTTTTNGFAVDPPSITQAYVYTGGGTIVRFYVPMIKTKQFPMNWSSASKTRIGVQQYLLTATAISQITLLMFLSQNDSEAFNMGPITPSIGTSNSGLVYSTVLYTCPESTNLGLTPANTNLQQLTATTGLPLTDSNNQQQIWHRVNTSLIGDTVQVGFTLSDAQMRDVNLIHQTAEIELHTFILDVTQSQVLA